MMSTEWAQPVATELLVIRMSRPFATKRAAKWVMNKCFFQYSSFDLTKCSLGELCSDVSMLCVDVHLTLGLASILIFPTTLDVAN